MTILLRTSVNTKARMLLLYLLCKQLRQNIGEWLDISAAIRSVDKFTSSLPSLLTNIVLLMLMFMYSVSMPSML